MAKNAKENAQVKGRTTKLSKKSVEELIEIILRKDKTERNLNDQVKKLKAEVNSCTERLSNVDKDMERTLKELTALKEEKIIMADAIQAANEKADELSRESSNNSYLLSEERNTNAKLRKEVLLYKVLAIGCAIAAVFFWFIEVI